jgi:hypothetical protein
MLASPQPHTGSLFCGTFPSRLCFYPLILISTYLGWLFEREQFPRDLFILVQFEAPVDLPHSDHGGLGEYVLSEAATDLHSWTLQQGLRGLGENVPVPLQLEAATGLHNPQPDYGGQGESIQFEALRPVTTRLRRARWVLTVWGCYRPPHSTGQCV